ncbi:MAG: hypothetical protein EA399_16590 [Desulfovibrionales bacterium]|nr:MAG: hypothetical protein EA399_16590 [Desulfovibrionales bacterium]
MKHGCNKEDTVKKKSNLKKTIINSIAKPPFSLSWQDIYTTVHTGITGKEISNIGDIVANISRIKWF